MTFCQEHFLNLGEKEHLYGMQLYGLIGYPLAHSFSKSYFTEKFASMGFADREYRNFPLRDIEEFPRLIASESELTGLNVTRPYKESVIEYLDSVDRHAAQIGAVNTICFSENGLRGYNTDWIGFRDSLLSIPPDRKLTGALILGSGGSSKAIAYALEKEKIKYRFVTRTKKSSRSEAFLYTELNPEIFTNYNLIINTTPLGTFPAIHEAPDINYTWIDHQHILYDLTYNPPVSKFLQLGKDRGAWTINGLEMLHLQAEASWELWQGHHQGLVL